MARRTRKPRIKIPPLENPDYDTGTPELRKREVVEIYGGDKKRRARVLSAPIDYYLARDFIDKDQHNAGTQFYKLWYHGGGRPHFSAMDLLRVPGAGEGEYSAIMRQKYRAALESLILPLSRRIVFDVVCVGEYAQSSMRAAIREFIAGASNPRNKSMTALRVGLDDLVKHFSRKRPYEGIDTRVSER